MRSESHKASLKYVNIHTVFLFCFSSLINFFLFFFFLHFFCHIVTHTQGHAPATSCIDTHAQICATAQKEKKNGNDFIKITLTDVHIHGHPYFLFSLTQPATWFEFLMFPIKIIISFLAHLSQLRRHFADIQKHVE